MMEFDEEKFVLLLKNGSVEEIVAFISELNEKEIFYKPLLEDGTRILHMAAVFNHGLIPILLSLGADPNLKDNDGRTALYWLLDCDNFPLEIAMRMIKKGVENCSNHPELTCLYNVIDAEDAMKHRKEILIDARQEIKNLLKKTKRVVNKIGRGEYTAYFLDDVLKVISGIRRYERALDFFYQCEFDKEKIVNTLIDSIRETNFFDMYFIFGCINYSNTASVTYCSGLRKFFELEIDKIMDRLDVDSFILKNSENSLARKALEKGIADQMTLTSFEMTNSPSKDLKALKYKPSLFGGTSTPPAEMLEKFKRLGAKNKFNLWFNRSQDAWEFRENYRIQKTCSNSNNH